MLAYAGRLQTQWVIVLEEDVSVEILGPFDSEEEQFAEAKEARGDGDLPNGVHWLNLITLNGKTYYSVQKGIDGGSMLLNIQEVLRSTWPLPPGPLSLAATAMPPDKIMLSEIDRSRLQTLVHLGHESARACPGSPKMGRRLEPCRDLSRLRCPSQHGRGGPRTFHWNRDRRGFAPEAADPLSPSAHRLAAGAAG